MRANGKLLSRRRLIQGAFVIAGVPLLLPSCRGRVNGNLSGEQQLKLTATEALAAMRNGRMSCSAYVSTLIDRATKASSLNAIISLNESAALAAARVVDRRRASGASMPRLAGLPILVKDNINTRDLPTSGGTPALRNFRPSTNAPVLQELLDAGVIVLGKANLHELSLGITSTNSATGYARNPYDPTRIPGGSSGGTAAGIAARIVPAGLGTDTGGSVRIPAALCGVVGMRPSVGNGGAERRYNASGVIPITHTKDTIGPMGRSVADVALLDSVICRTRTATGVDIAGLRIGIPRAYYWENLDAEVDAILRSVVQRLKSAGVVFVEADVAGLGESTASIGSSIAMGELWEGMTRYLRAAGSAITVEQIAAQAGHSDVSRALESSRTAGRDSYTEAMRSLRPALQARYAAYFAVNDVHAMLIPTTPLPAVAIDSTFSGAISINGIDQPGGRRAAFRAYTRNTDPASNAGIPCLSLPAGVTMAGLPVGLELDGPLGSDSALLAVGLTIEGMIGTIAGPPLN